MNDKPLIDRYFRTIAEGVTEVNQRPQRAREE